MAKRDEDNKQGPFPKDPSRSRDYDVVTPAGMINSSVDKQPYEGAWGRWGNKDQSIEKCDHDKD